MLDAGTDFNEDGFEQIAVIGLACRFPGAPTRREFWRNLKDGVESIQRYSEAQLRAMGLPSEWLKNPRFVRAGTVLNDVDRFDASFFGYSPREAMTIDPQQRIFLETAWEALEDAGYAREAEHDSFGVFAGVNQNQYLPLAERLVEPADTSGELELLFGNEKDFLATRVSYKLNLTGPSLTVQTACSTSLVTVCLACQSLLNYQCSLALAGGVTVNLRHSGGYFFQEGTILSPDGHCRAFDENAAGTVIGQGVGVVVLKRLSDALEDGDCIHAVIKSSAVNNDGAMKVGFTAPSVEGQANVVALSHALANVSAESITYIETHGTGTKLGDPVEIAALNRVFKAGTSKTAFCGIGSVKTNIGHADAAAGIAGLIKTVLMLEHGERVPSLHFQRPNPEIDFDGSPFFVVTRLSEWNSAPHPRRAGVSAFGIGGTNSHLVLEEAPAQGAPGPCRSHQLLILSARTPTALDAASRNLAQFLEENPALNLADAAYTLQVGRHGFNCRRMLVVRSSAEAISTLVGEGRGTDGGGAQQRRDPPVVFMFSGQGAQYARMGQGLYESEAVFRKHLDHCADLLGPLVSRDIRSLLFPPAEKSAAASEELKQTALAQPVLFAVEYALAQLWMSWGIQPEAMIGHSIGEYVAACLAGVFTLPDALALVAARGRLMHELPTGAMAAIALSESDARAVAGERVDIAAVNAPALTVVSGETRAVEDLIAGLASRRVACRRLHTSHAFHSRMMEPMADEFTHRLDAVRRRPPSIPYVSNLSGTWITPEEAVSASYWVDHLLRPVRFAAGVRTLFSHPERVLLEVGPGNVLASLARQQAAALKGRVILSCLPHPQAAAVDTEVMLTALGKLWLAGVQPDWRAFQGGFRRRRVSLPSYPFERRRFWPESAADPNPSCAAGLPVAAQEGFCRAEAGAALHEGGAAPPAPAKGGAPPLSGRAVEQALVGIWQKVLGIAQIGVHEDYFDLGGTSLLAARIFAEIEKRFGKRIPLATLLGAPTISKLAPLVAEEDWAAAWSALVPLRREGANPPFFCVHGAGGNVLLYRDLARRLGPNQPFYGLQSRGLDGVQPFQERIEDMAAFYIEEIRTAQPQGPYCLGGYCMGGTIALEMAQQLRTQGEAVALLAFFETYNWIDVPPPNVLQKSHFLIQKLDFHLRNFIRAPEPLTFIQEKLKIASDRKTLWIERLKPRTSDSPGPKEEENGWMGRLWETNDRAALAYRPRPYPGRITHFCPVQDYRVFRRPTTRWKGLAAGGVDERRLPVYPAGMLVEPFVGLLAEDLRRCIERAAGERNSTDSTGKHPDIRHVGVR